MSGLKFSIKIPGFTATEAKKILGATASVIEQGEGVDLVMPWGQGDGAIPIYQADLPLDHAGEAIHIRKIDDLRKLSSASPEGGLSLLLQQRQANQLLDHLEQKLSAVWQRLQKKDAVYVFAAHLNAVKCVQYCKSLGLEILGFIDNDTRKHGQEFRGKKIFALDQIDKGALIINASGRYCVEIDRQLESAGYRSRLNFMEFLFLFDLPFQAQKGFRDYIKDLVANRHKVASLYLALDDEMSRKVMDDILLYRLTLDSTFVGRIASPYNEEFFAKDLLQFSDAEVFVDGGAYDGDSFLRFRNMAPTYAKAYLFEPDGAICQKTKAATADDPRAEVCNVGLHSSTGELRFSSTGGMDGAISADGELRIEVVSLDEFVKEKITHIKLDVEGAEEAALLGAKKHMSQDRPKIAIAVYHKAADLWEIPALIESLGGPYRFSIRHYSQTMDDSIIYAFPLNS